MTYSLDFRHKVVAFVRDGGGQAEAARRFDISLWCVRDGLARNDLRPQQKPVPPIPRWSTLGPGACCVRNYAPHSTIIYDKAAFHQKHALEAIARQYGHHILFLPALQPRP
jgi:hypothetical protein